MSEIYAEKREPLTGTLLIGILLRLVILEDREGGQQAFLSLAIGRHNATDHEILSCWRQMMRLSPLIVHVFRGEVGIVIVPCSQRGACVIKR